MYPKHSRFNEIRIQLFETEKQILRKSSKRRMSQGSGDAAGYEDHAGWDFHEGRGASAYPCA